MLINPIEIYFVRNVICFLAFQCRYAKNQPDGEKQTRKDRPNEAYRLFLQRSPAVKIIKTCSGRSPGLQCFVSDPPSQHAIGIASGILAQKHITHSRGDGSGFGCLVSSAPHSLIKA
jgi:hypothetical protein